MLQLYGFNRTLLELKHLVVGAEQCARHSFNRTLLELKRRSKRGLRKVEGALIEPYWN